MVCIAKGRNGTALWRFYCWGCFSGYVLDVLLHGAKSVKAFETIHEWDDVTGQQKTRNPRHSMHGKKCIRNEPSLSLLYILEQIKDFFAMAILIFLQAGFRHDRLIMSWVGFSYTYAVKEFLTQDSAYDSAYFFLTGVHFVRYKVHVYFVRYKSSAGISAVILAKIWNYHLSMTNLLACNVR